MNTRYRSCFSLCVITVLLVISLAGTSCTAKKGRKVILVGFDGLAYDRVSQMVEEGSLPHFSQIRKDGASGALASSIPALPPTAWTTAVTGVNPGKHGIYCYAKGFVNTDKDHFAISYHSAVDRGAAPLWKLLDESGLRSVVINVPFTSPPDSINGLMVAGGPHPDTTDFAYPAGLMRKFPVDYTLAMTPEEVEQKKSEDYAEYLKGIYEERKASAFELLDAQNWDLFLVVFTIPDRIQSYYWRCMDRNHPYYSEEAAARCGTLVDDIYREMDSALGELEDRAAATGANLFAFSVYGHEPVYWTLNGENFIRAHWPMGKKRDIFVGSSDGQGGLFAISFKKPPEVNKENWEKYSNLSGEILQGLRSIRNPETGESVIDTVYHRSQIYSGPAEVSAPDIIAIEKPGYLFENWHMTEDGTVVQKPRKGSISSHPGGDGILFARGPDITPGSTLTGANILDIVPTVLYLEAASIPSYMDGHVLTAMIRGEELDRQPVDALVKDVPLETGEKNRKLTEEEEQTLRNQLKTTGYVK
jgi:predicted AlkP superfamily phosphohydrolase/phosphomutase